MITITKVPNPPPTPRTRKDNDSCVGRIRVAFTDMLKAPGDCLDVNDFMSNWMTLFRAARDTGMKITTRKTTTGFRVWRVK